MRRKIEFLFIIFSLVSTVAFCILIKQKSQKYASQILADYPIQKYELEWEENFDGKSLNLNDWNKIKRVSSSVAWNKYMSDNESLYQVDKGRLRLYARRNTQLEPNDTAKYLTGGISTEHKHTFTYGKIEVRARIKGVKGCWPAIWIKDDDRTSPNYKELAEIDVIEYYNTDDKVTCTIHSTYTDVMKKTTDPISHMSAPISKNKYNTYAIEILPDCLIWSVNGERRFIYPRIAEEGFKQFPFGSACYLMIDMQVGNQWLKEIDNNSFPAYMDIDWVKFYKLAE